MKLLRKFISSVHYQYWSKSKYFLYSNDKKNFLKGHVYIIEIVVKLHKQFRIQFKSISLTVLYRDNTVMKASKLGSFINN